MAESRGMDIIKASDGSILFRAQLFDAVNAKITAGTVSLRLWHVVPTDGTFESFKWNTDTWVDDAVENTDPTVAMVHQAVTETGPVTYNTGVWTYRQTVLTNFTIGDKYIAEVSHASLPHPISMEFQYGDFSGESDFLRMNMATAGAATTITLDAGAPATLDYYRGCTIGILAGTGAGQARTILSYSVGRVATVSHPWATNPDATSVFCITPARTSGIIVQREGTAAGGAAGTITLDASAPATLHYFRGCQVTIVGGTGIGQSRTIVAYSAARVATVSPPWVTAPDNTSIFQITGAITSGNQVLREGIATAGAATSITLDASAVATLNYYKGCHVSIIDGTGVGQTRTITDYTVGRVANVSPPWATNPDNTSVFQLTAAQTTSPTVLREGTAAAGAATSITLDASAVATLNYYKGCQVRILSGTGAGQTRTITDYTAARVANVSPPWATNPDNTSVFQLTAAPTITPTVLREATAAAGAASSITLDASASATLNYYKGCQVRILSGTGAGQTRTITDYTVGRVANVSPPWATAPDNTSVFQLTAAPTITPTVLREATATAGAAETITLDGSASATLNYYKGCQVRILSGTGAGQSRTITWYTVGRVATVSPPWATNPDATSVFQITPAPTTIETVFREATATGGAAGSITLDASASATLDYYKGCRVNLIGGTGAGQSRYITTYSVGRVATVVPNWATNPDATTVFQIVGDVDVLNTADAVWDEDIVAAHGTASTAGLLLRVLGAEISTRAFNATLNDLLGVPDTAATDTVAGQVWEELAASHNNPNTMGEIMNTLTGAVLLPAIADAVWDEDIVAAHGAASAAGLLLRCLGEEISTRANWPTLHALLGVPDSAGHNIGDTIWNSDITHWTVADVGQAGWLLNVLGMSISARTNSPDLNALLGVPDTAGLTIAFPIWNEVINNATYNVVDSAGRRLWTLDDLTEAGGAGDLAYILGQTQKVDQAACDSPATADSLADKLDTLAATVATIDRDIITSLNIQGNTLRIEVAAEQYGLVLTALYTQCSAQIFDEAGGIIATIGVGDFGAITGRGFFQYTLDPHPLAAGQTYQIQILLTDGALLTYQNTKLFKVVNV